MAQNRPKTIVETVDQADEPVGYTPTSQESTEDGAVAFRPVFRPPMAALTILDDGSRDRGETIRLRTERTVIGRTTGDVVIPHDNGISGEHAEVTRELKDGQYRWFLRDLDSTNGTFVRVQKATLRHNQNLVIGARRYCFNAAPQGAQEADDGDDAPKGTQAWQAVNPATLSNLLPSLTELQPAGEGPKQFLDKAENVVGSDPQAANICLKDDPFVSPTHCRIYKDDRGRWKIENSDSQNGLWLSVEEMPMDLSGEFQLGEQRFILKVF